MKSHSEKRCSNILSMETWSEGTQDCSTLKILQLQYGCSSLSVSEEQNEVFHIECHHIILCCSVGFFSFQTKVLNAAPPPQQLWAFILVMSINSSKAPIHPNSGV